jgi:hypothetical protein
MCGGPFPPYGFSLPNPSTTADRPQMYGIVYKGIISGKATPIISRGGA